MKRFLQYRPLTALAVAGLVIVPILGATNAANAAPVSVDFQAATRGFDILTEGDTFFSGNESEGAAAVGGDVRFNGFQLMGHNNPGTAPGNTQVGLLTGGTVKLAASSGTLNINNGGQIRVGESAGLKLVGNADQNGVVSGNNRALVPDNDSFSTTPRVQVNNSTQDPSSVAAPGLFGQLFGGVFKDFKQLGSCLAILPTTAGLKLHDIDRGNTVVEPGVSLAGKKLRLELVQGKTNIWTISASELNSITEVGFFAEVNPSATTPLVINVTSSGVLSPMLLVNGNRDAGLRSILWNLNGDVTLSGSRPLPGTFFAPNNTLTVNATNNVEGQLIGRELNVKTIGEQHTHQFWGTLECHAPEPTPTSTPTTTPTTTPTPTPTVTPTPTPTPTSTPTPATSPPPSPSPSMTPTSQPTSSPTKGNTPPTAPGGLAATGSDLSLASVLTGVAVIMMAAGAAILVRRKLARK